MASVFSSAIRWSIFLPKQSQNLDLSYKTDLDLWDCLGTVKLLCLWNSIETLLATVFSSAIRWSFFLPKQSPNLDLSYKTDLDLWDCLGTVKLLCLWSSIETLLATVFSSAIRWSFFLTKQSQNLDLSYKTDLDLWDCLGTVKLLCLWRSVGTLLATVFSSAIRWSFFLPKQSQNLDLSYKTDLDLWDCLGTVKLLCLWSSIETLLATVFSSAIRWSFFLTKQSQNLDLSYKTDLDLWDCLGTVKLLCLWSSVETLLASVFSSAIRWSIFLPKQSQNLDLSYKTDLHLWDCLGTVKLLCLWSSGETHLATIFSSAIRWSIFLPKTIPKSRSVL